MGHKNLEKIVKLWKRKYKSNIKLSCNKCRIDLQIQRESARRRNSWKRWQNGIPRNLIGIIWDNPKIGRLFTGKCYTDTEVVNHYIQWIQTNAITLNTQIAEGLETNVTKGTPL